MTSNKQTQGFGRVVFTIPALVAGEVALLSQKVIKLIQSNLLTLVTGFIEKFKSSAIHAVACVTGVETGRG